MAGKQPESEQKIRFWTPEQHVEDSTQLIQKYGEEFFKQVELPPQGIGPERKMRMDDRIVQFVKSCTDEAVGVNVLPDGTVDLTFRRVNSSFDKHDADGVMWEIHWLLGELETRLNCPHLGEYSDITIRVSIPKSSFNHLCDELQGVEHED